MKKWKCALAAGLILVSLLFSVTAFAAQDQYKEVDTKPNTWITAKSYESHYDEEDASKNYDIYYRYKVTVPSSGYLKIQGDDPSFYAKLNDPESYAYHVYTNTVEIDKIPVDKGTYYFGSDDYDIRFKYSFQSVPMPKNYCAKKAVKLKAGKTVTAWITKQHYYCRWYKIKLTKKKKITFWSNGFVDVYSSDYNKVKVEKRSSGGTKCVTGKQKKGTYYFRVRTSGPIRNGLESSVCYRKRAVRNGSQDPNQKRGVTYETTDAGQ